MRDPEESVFSLSSSEMRADEVRWSVSEPEAEVFWLRGLFLRRSLVICLTIVFFGDLPGSLLSFLR